jgi:hypothetical protein
VRRVAAVVSPLLLLLALSTPAWAQYPPAQPTCQVNKTTAAPGEDVTVSGDDWQASSQVLIRFHQNKVSQEYGPFPTDGTGHFSANITIPLEAQNGPARIAVGGPNQSGKRVSCEVDITIQTGGGGGGNGTVCDIDDATPAPGQSVKVNGRKWQPQSTVTIRFAQGANNQVMGTAEVNGSGRFAKNTTIPPSAQPGPAQVRVDGTDENGDPQTCVIAIEVSASSSARSMAVAPPFTPASIALLLGTVGTIAVVRRRRTRALVRPAR